MALPHQQIFNTTADAVSAGAIVAAFLGWLPPLAAVAAIIWYCLQIYESKTFQKWVRLHKHRRIRHRRKHLEKPHDPPCPAVRD